MKKIACLSPKKLSFSGDYEISFQCTDIEDFFRYLAKFPLEKLIILLLFEGKASELPYLKQIDPGNLIIVYAPFCSPFFQKSCFRAGVDECYCEDLDQELFLFRINRKLDRSDQRARRFIKKLDAMIDHDDLKEETDSTVRELLTLLTDRQTKILRELGIHIKNSKIAASLSLQPKTISNELSIIKKKLGLSTRDELRQYARTYLGENSAVRRSS